MSKAWIVSADCDDDASIAALGRFAVPPSIVVASGGITAAGRDKLHAHWCLREPVGPAELVDAKRRLALALGSDRAVCDAARIMRIPGTRNHKTDPSRPVRLLLAEPRPARRLPAAEGQRHAGHASARLPAHRGVLLHRRPPE